MDIASVNRGNSYHVYCVKTTNSKLNSEPVLVVPYLLYSQRSINPIIQLTTLFSPSISEVNKIIFFFKLSHRMYLYVCHIFFYNAMLTHHLS